MLSFSFDQATGQTLALLATFVVAIGGVVTVLVAYVIAQVFVEHKQNQEREEEFE
jgi:phage shock protein PspC (stress-responsive transcriptional regulator)